MRILQDRFADAQHALGLFQATVDALPYNLTVLDGEGVIVLVNDAWKEFGALNGLLDASGGVGSDYLEACRRARDVDGDDGATARQVLRGIEDLLEGRTDRFVVEYPCHSPLQKRWFQVIGTAVEQDARPWVVLVHEDVTARHLVTAAMAGKLAAHRTWAREEDVKLIAGLATGRQRLNLQPIDLAPHLDAVHAAFAAQLPEGNRVLTKRVLGPLAVQADTRALGQALLELLLNAYAATGPGGSIHLEAGVEGDEVRLCVIDDGRGFEPHELAARMEAVDIEDDPEGIGLALAQTVAEHHGGELRLASDGHGAVAVLALPRAALPRVA